MKTEDPDGMNEQRAEAAAVALKAFNRANILNMIAEAAVAFDENAALPELTAGEYLVIDAETDATETSSRAMIVPMAGPLAGKQISTGNTYLIRALYDSPSATSYGEGSYTVSL